MGSKPKAPDPYATAQAQGEMNQNTATQQQLLNMVDQHGPQGSITYNQTGTSTFVGADGKTYTVPKMSQTTSLTPNGQAIYDASEGAQLNLANTANNQTALIQDMLSKPFEYNNQDAENWAYDLASPRLLEQQGRNDSAIRSKLINSGIREGSEAWNSAMTRQGYLNNDQMNQLALNGRQQSFNEALTTRNQPINEITALLTGSQVSNPNYSATPQSQVAGVDYAGLVNQNYQNELQAYGSGMGGLFGGLASLGGAAVSKWSDERLKDDIEPVGRLENGLTVYRYRYRGSQQYEIGLIAQEVMEANPSAVSMHDGFYAVDYLEATQ